jgi:predicted RNase H-like HicB family nuclease
MALMNDRYTYGLAWSAEDSQYVGLCIEFPSLSWLAQTPEEALQGIRDVVAGVVEDMATIDEVASVSLATGQ